MTSTHWRVECGSLLRIMVLIRAGAFPSLLNLPRSLAPKYLTSLMLWSFSKDENSAPEIELRP